MTTFAESVVEDAALAWLAGVGWRLAQPGAELSEYGEVILPRSLRTALSRLNPDLPAEALEDVACRWGRGETDRRRVTPCYLFTA